MHPMSSFSAPHKTRAQTGFPARITSTYSSTTGYTWEMLVLDTNTASPAVSQVTNPATGNYAFTPDDNQSLSSGNEGWLEPDPGGCGWLFLQAGSFSPTAASVDLGSPTTIDATDTTLVNCTLSSQGWWLVTAAIGLSVSTSAGTGTVGMWVRDETNTGNIIADPTLYYNAMTLPTTGVTMLYEAQYTAVYHLTGTAPATARLHAIRAGGTFTTCIALATKTYVTATRFA